MTFQKCSQTLGPDATLSAVTFAAAIPFLLTSLHPVTSMTKTSAPKITANVTMAPMTPATGFEMPSEDDDEAVDPEAPDGVVDAEAQLPVVTPQALHQDAWSPIANLFISVTNVFHGI